MAFTSAQRADIHYYTGWSARWHQVDSDLERAISAVEGDADVEAIIVGLIADCKLIDTNIKDAYNRLKALKVGSIDLPGSGEINELQKQGRKFASRICSTLGVERRHDVFGSSATSGRQTYGGMTGGGKYGLHG